MRIDVVFIDIDGAKVNEVIDVFVKQAQGRIRKKTNSAVIALPADPNNANSPHKGTSEITITQYEDYVGVMGELPYDSNYMQWSNYLWLILTRALPHHMRLEVQDCYDNIIYEAERPAVSAEKPVA